MVKPSDIPVIPKSKSSTKRVKTDARVLTSPEMLKGKEDKKKKVVEETERKKRRMKRERNFVKRKPRKRPRKGRKRQKKGPRRPQTLELQEHQRQDLFGT